MDEKWLLNWGEVWVIAPIFLAADAENNLKML